MQFDTQKLSKHGVTGGNNKEESYKFSTLPGSKGAITTWYQQLIATTIYIKHSIHIYLILSLHKTGKEGIINNSISQTKRLKLTETDEKERHYLSLHNCTSETKWYGRTSIELQVRKSVFWIFDPPPHLSLSGSQLPHL